MKQAFVRLWQRLLRRLGSEGLIGLALIAAAAGFALSTDRLEKDSRVTLDQAEARRRQADQAARARGPVVSPQDAQRSFVESFPSPTQNAADLEKVFAAADRIKLQLAKGEYHIVAEAHSPFVTYVATFPIKDSYPNVRDFAVDVLKALPHASLEEMRLERTNSTATTLDARVRINLFYRLP